MIDIGLYSDSAYAHLARQLAVIRLIDHWDDQLAADPGSLADPGSELAVLAAGAPDAPVDLLSSVRAGLTAARGSLDHIASILTRSDPPTSTIVLQALTRTALLGAGRVVFALGPADPVQRRRNVRIAMRQEAQNLMRGLDSFSGFKHLLALKPADDYVTEQRERDKAIQGGQRPVGETRTLVEMAHVIGERLVASGLLIDPDDPVPAAVAEHIMWVWHAYSGAAHGLGWPLSLTAAASIVGDFVADLGTVVPIAQLAFRETIQHSRVER